VYVVAGAGGVVQLVGCVYLLRVLRAAAEFFCTATTRWLTGLAVVTFLLKNVLQAALAWPGLTGLANHRFTVIAFLHLVFLGIVAPLVFALALRLGWLRDGWALRLGLLSFVGGAAVSEVLLVTGSLAGVYSGSVMFFTAVTMLAGVALLIASTRLNPVAVPPPSTR
jgi:hypothetical protein